jgi:hypothetical protein
MNLTVVLRQQFEARSGHRAKAKSGSGQRDETGVSARPPGISWSAGARLAAGGHGKCSKLEAIH